ncbi:MAG: acyltransferase [Deltaproteobacteria bacterium]|nr:acyltransferase [Deltaproteobacteria bacterium]
MSEKIPPSGAHLPALDGLRGTVLIVLACHFIPAWKPESFASAVLFHLKDMGWVSVDIFFVLSGYLITGILLDTKGRPAYFKNFYVRRALRIFPLFYGVLIAGTLLGRFTAPLFPGEQGAAGEHWLYLWSYNVNLAVAVKHNWLTAVGPFATGHLWSLAVEEQFYLLWPVLVFACSRRGLVRLCVGIIALAVVSRGVLLAMGRYDAIYVLTPCRADTLAVGALLAVAAREDGGLSRWVKPAVWIGGGSALILVALAFTSDGLPGMSPRNGTYGHLLATLANAGVLIVAIERPAGLIGRSARSRFLRFFGKYSYGLYVFHALLHPLMNRALNRFGIGTESDAPVAQLAVAFVLKFGLSVVIAAASFHLFEQPFLRLKSRFESKEPRAPREVAPAFLEAAK